MKNSTKDLWVDYLRAGAFLYILISPHFFLDYHFETESLSQFLGAYGQYIYFFSSFMAATVLFNKNRLQFYLKFLRIRFFLFCILLLILGVGISSTSVWNVRLSLLVLYQIFLSFLCAEYILKQKSFDKKKLFTVSFFPVFFPVCFSLWLELFGPIEIYRIIFDNIKHSDDFNYRWKFLHSSANGFAFDAALALLVSFSMFLSYRTSVLGLMWLCLTFIATYVLYKTETRAAMIFTFFGVIFSIYFNYHHYRKKIIFGFVITFLTVFLVGFKVFELSDFFRIHGTWNQISTGRLDATINAFRIFIENPIIGVGFGEADRNFPVHPSNIFYASLALELGIFGFVGGLCFIGFPVFSYLKKHSAHRFEQSLYLHFPTIQIISLLICLSWFLYLFFEFNILRVSAYNCIFFFCWSILFLTQYDENI